MSSKQNLSEEGPAASTPEQSPIKREKIAWEHSIESTACCVNLVVSFSNIWSIPYNLYSTGILYLVPYLTALIFFTFPMLYLEVIIGQFSGKSNVGAFSAMAPPFAAIGWIQEFAVVVLSSILSTFSATSLYYFVLSFNYTMPWTVCKPEWETCLASTIKNQSLINRTVSTEFFYREQVLQYERDFEQGIELPSIYLTLCSFFVWFGVFLICYSCVKSLGTLSFVSLLSSLFVFFIIFIRTIRLKGAAEGIYYFLTPRWSAMADLKTWRRALIRSCHSLSIGFGNVLLVSSFNDFNYKAKVIAVAVVVLDTILSLAMALTAATLLGNLAHDMNVTISDVIRDGPGLTFMSYTHALSQLQSKSNLFTALYFFMLLNLGMGSLSVNATAIYLHLVEHFPKIRKIILASCVSIVGFLGSVVFLTPQGLPLIHMLFEFALSVTMEIIQLLQMILVFYIYGLQNFVWDLEYMSQKPVSVYYRISWAITCPVIITLMIGSGKMHHHWPKHSSKIVALGWGIFIISLLQLPLFTIYYLFKYRKHGWYGSIIKTFSSGKWRPYEPEYYQEWRSLKNVVIENRKRLNHNRFVKFFMTLIGK